MMAWLSYTLPANPLIEAIRLVCIFLGVVCAVFALYHWRRLGTDRGILFLLIGLQAVLIEWQQVQTRARFLVWRLPLLLLLVSTALWAGRNYVADRHHLDDPRVR